MRQECPAPRGFGASDLRASALGASGFGESDVGAAGFGESDLGASDFGVVFEASLDSLLFWLL